MLIADGGGGSVPPASVPAAAPTQQPPSTTSTQADAAARARELQHQLEQLLERLREAQRRAEEARQRALEAQQRAETARKAAEAARKKADQGGNAGDQAASAKARQDWKVQDAQMKKAAADADLQQKDVALLRAQVAQKREQVKSHDGTASAAADQKVKDAQGARDAASRTSDLAKLYSDVQDKESKAQDAEAKLATLRPHNRFEAEEFTPDQRSALTKAQADASGLRGDADAAQSKFKAEVDKDADLAFYGEPPAGGTPPGVTPATAAAVGNDPLHTPLLQLLQVSPASATNAPLFTSAPGSSLASGTTWSANTTFSPFLTRAGASASPQLAQTLSGLADGKSLAQVASDQHMSVDQVVAQARAGGIDVQAGAPSGDVQVTTLRKGTDTLAYSHNLKDDSVTVKGSYTDAGVPGGQRDIDVSKNRDGVFSQTVKDPKTGRDVVHQFDPAAGTRTDIVTADDKTRTETTTDLTATPVTHTVRDGEGYLDIAKDAGLTPEQLLALNPDVDYGAPLKPGQELVVAGVQTTVKTFNPDHTTLERTTASDGTLQVVATDASGHRNVLMGDPDPSNPQADAIRKALFDDRKTIAQTAASLGLTEQQLVEALPPGTVDDTPASADNQGIRTRTIYDPQTNRSFVQIDDPRHDRTVVQEIAADQVFHVRQYDNETKRYVMQDVRGGAGYAQSLADQRQATADDYGKQISDLDNTIRLFHHTGDDPSELLAQRATLVAQQKAAQGQADIAQGKASAVMTRHEQVQVDQSASIAYQNWFVARPGSKDQAAAAVELRKMLTLSDQVDRLVASSDKDVGLLVAGVDKQRADDAKSAADDKLQAAFQDWKANDWGWGAIPKEQADKMKAKGERPPYLPYYQDAQQENDAAWSDFVDMQKDMDKYGTDGYPPSMVAAHDAWVQRNQASDAALKVDLRFDDASSASNSANQNVLQGEIDRLEQDKANWVQANPDKFKENYGNQKQLDQLNASLAQDQIDALNLGEDKKFTQYMTTVSAPDREDPDQLKKAEQKYAKDNQDATTQLNRRIDELQTGGMVAKDKAAEAYIAAWKTRNPALAARLEALGTFDPPGTQGSVRAAEYRQEQTALLLKGAGDQGKQLQDAMNLHQQAYDQFLQRGGEDVQHVQGDHDAIKKDIDGHTFVRDIWDACGGDDASKDALKYTDGQLDKATQLRDDLASGKISVSDFASREDQFLNRYDHTSSDFQRRIQDSDGTWSVVDEAVRTTVSAAAGIAATIASGGNVAVGFAVGLGVSELWDTTGDLVAAAQGRDVNADGHTSLLTLEAKAATGQASWDDVKFTLKDEALDVASNAVTLTGVGAGARVTESLTAQLALKDSLSVGGRTLLKVGFKEGSTDTLTWGGRAIVGAGAGVTSQAVDGVGRVGVETLHVGLDGQLGTEQGNARISSTIAASATGLLTAPVTGAFSGAIPLRTSLPGLGIGGQIVNDTVGSLGTGELVSLATEGRTMNRAEFVAASLNIGPSVLQHVAIHPMMARAQARAEAAARSGAPAARAAVPDDASGDVAAPSTRATDDGQVLFQQAGGDDVPVSATKQLPLYGDKPWVAPPAARPRLDKQAGQRIVDLVHMAGPNAPQSMTGRTIGLTELADGRVVVTVSGKKSNLNPNQRRVAQLLLRESGFEGGDILMLEVTKGNQFGIGHKARRLDPDTRPVSWHAEQKGIQAGKLAGSDAVRQWSSSGKNPRGTEQGGHGGAACPVCQLAQADYRVVNETGLQPPEGEPVPYLLSDGRAWGGRDDRVDREIPGVDWESLRTRPDFLDPPKPSTTAKPAAPLAAKPGTPAAADDPLAQAARRGNASPQAAAGWDDRFLQRVALHPDVQGALLEVIRQEHTGKGANPAFDLDMLYGNEQRVRGTARDNPQMFRRQVLAAWHALERAGNPVEVDGRTPIVTARPTSYRIRPSRDFQPKLDTVQDYANALKGVTSQSNEIAKALEDGRIKVELLSGADYRATMRDRGKDPGRVLAMARHDVVTLNQDARPWERLLSMVHEGTHALDWIAMRGAAKTGTIPIGDLEGRAYFHENEFAQAMGLHGHGRGDAFPALVRPQVLHPTMRDTHQHIDAAYPQATSPWRPTEKPTTGTLSADATALDQRSGPPAAGADAVHAAFASGLRQAGLSFADDPAGMLFRFDTQAPGTLRAAGGVRPRPGVGVVTRPSLTSYVEANTPGRWVGTSKSVRHIADFVAAHPERVQPGETAWLYVMNPAARSRQDVLAHYAKSGGLDGLQPPIRRAVEREGEVAVDGGMPWEHVFGWAEVDPATGEFAGPFQRNPDYAAPVARPRQVVLRMPDGSPAQPPAGAAAAATPDPATVTRSTLPDLSTGWQPVLRLPARAAPDASAAPVATPALFVVQHAGSGPRSIFDPASGQWVDARPVSTPPPAPVTQPVPVTPVAASKPPAATTSPPAPATQPATLTPPATATAKATTQAGTPAPSAPAPQPNTVRVTPASAHTPPAPATATHAPVSPVATPTPASAKRPTAANPVGAPAAAAPLAPPTRRRVYGSAAAGVVVLGGVGAFATLAVPAHILGTAFSWATAGAAMRSAVKFVRFSHARTWEGRIANMSGKSASKATFEQALDKLDSLGQRRLAAGADPTAHAEFASALDQVRTHAASRKATVPLLKRGVLRQEIAHLRTKARALGVQEAKADKQTARLKAGASDRVAFDHYLALHERFVEKGKSGSRTLRWLAGVDTDKATLLGENLAKVKESLVALNQPGNAAVARRRLDKAVRGLSVAPKLRDDPKTPARRAIDTVQIGTYAVSLGSLANSIRTAPRFSFSAAGHTLSSAPHFAHALATNPTIAVHSLMHAVASLPTEWPGVVVSSVFAVSTLADGARILGSRFGAMKAPSDREAVTTHPLYAKVLPKTDDTATVHGGAASLVKGALFGQDRIADVAAAATYTVGAWFQRREARGRGYVDPSPDDIVGRKRVFNHKIAAAGAGLVLAGEALASQWLDGEKKKKDDPGPATPAPTPTSTSTAPPAGTTTIPGTTPPGPAPAPRSKLVVVDASDPRTAALWGIAHANESSLLPQAEIRRARAEGGDDAVTLDALRHLFQLNPQRGFRPNLMDGVPSARQGDPDTIQPGWKIEVQDPALP